MLRVSRLFPGAAASLALLLLLAACSPATPRAAPPPTQAATAPPTAPPPPTSTPRPASTPSLPPPTGTASPSPVPPTSTPTIDTTPTAIIQALLTAVRPRTAATFVSPDRAWRADLLIYDCASVAPETGVENAYDLLQVVRIQDAQVFPARAQLQNCGGLGAFGLGGLAWSPNSRYFYFTDAREGVPDGGPVAWHPAIYRFDTTRLQTEVLGGGLFSPGRKSIAAPHSSESPGCLSSNPRLTVWDVDGPVLASYPLTAPKGGCWLGDFSWHPAGKELVYIETACDANQQCVTSLYRADLSGSPARPLFEKIPPGFQAVQWATGDRLSLVDLNYKTWFYTISTGELAPQP